MCEGLQFLPSLGLAACFEACLERSGPPAAALAPCWDESCMDLAMQGCGAEDERAAGEEGGGGVKGGNLIHQAGE